MSDFELFLAILIKIFPRHWVDLPIMNVGKLNLNPNFEPSMLRSVYKQMTKKTQVS